MFKFFIVGITALTVVLASEKAASKNCVYHGMVFPESNVFIPAPIGFCLSLKCVKAEGNTISMKTCPSMATPPGTHLGEKDLTKEYPQCCPKLIHS